MDRILVQPVEIPTDTMFLATNKNAMLALGYLTQAVLGNSTAVDGFVCTPTIPASLSVLLTTGSIYSLQNVDSVAYLTQGIDTGDQILKQGIVRGNTTLACPAPTTSGQSINYLIQIAFSETDTNPQNIQFYNSADPSVPLTQNINTLRKSSATLSAKAGAAATTGTQTTPAPDAGYVGLYVVTVANGQTTITSGNISQLATAPFLSVKLGSILSAIQSGAANYGTDTSGSANTITVAITPQPTSLVTGQRVWVKVANTTTNSSAVMNVSGLGNVALYETSGNPLHKGGVIAGGIYPFVYDGAHWVLEGPAADTLYQGIARPLLTSTLNLYVATTGSDSNPGTSGSPFLTLQHAVNVALTYDFNGQAVNINVADGTYTGNLSVSPFTGGGSLNLIGNVTTPANCIIAISASGVSNISAQNGVVINISGFKLTNSGGGNGIFSTSGAQINMNGPMEYGAFTGGSGAHLCSQAGGLLQVTANYKISGGANAHYSANALSELTCGAPTVTLTGTPAFTDFALVSDAILAVSSSTTTFSGSATGVRYIAQFGGLIQTNGSGSSYLPGNSAGSSTGGFYN